MFIGGQTRLVVFKFDTIIHTFAGNTLISRLIAKPFAMEENPVQIMQKEVEIISPPRAPSPEQLSLGPFLHMSAHNIDALIKN